MLQRSIVLVVFLYVGVGVVMTARAQSPEAPVPTWIPPGQHVPAGNGIVQPILTTERSEFVFRDPPPSLAGQPAVAEQAALLVAGDDLKPAVKEKMAQAEKGKSAALWFTSMSGLVMTRDRANDVGLSRLGSTGPVDFTTRDADMGWGGGFDIRFGRFFNERRQAWEVVYWGLFADTEVANRDQLGLGTRDPLLAFDMLTYNGRGNPVFDFYANAVQQRLRRDNEFHNVEANLWGNTHGIKEAGSLQIGWQAGIRFLRFRESLHFMADGDAGDGLFTGGIDEIDYSMETENRLLGFQLGGLAQQGLSDRWSMHAGVKVALLGNHMTNNSRIDGSAGAAFIDDLGGATDRHPYDIHSQKNDVAMLGEIDLGATYQIRQRWRAFLGYRAVALTGVALPTNQFPTDFSDLPGASVIRSNGSLILHGGYAGIELLY